ncbi:MAG: ImmA/IrrE family metallo-endopeptidase [Clostridia bacterium]|jgi:Zn-dependent peptidase ImmA (M78 family)|nr:ImmA/IrrE family metallo-endopeptidase [Clostridia bacterium]
MGAQNRESIEQEAEILLDEFRKQFHQQLRLPIPVELIAELLYKLRLDITNLGRNAPGKLILNEKRIVLNSADGIPRQRFTVAHEIGHICLRHVFFNAESDRSKSLTTSPKNKKEMEDDANAFAASLLMPRGLVCESFLREILDHKDAKWRNLVNLKGIRIMAKRGGFRPRLLNQLLRSYIFQNNKGHPTKLKRATLLLSLIPRIATKFQVSKEALARRVRDLGLIDEFIVQEKQAT